MNPGVRAIRGVGHALVVERVVCGGGGRVCAVSFRRESSGYFMMSKNVIILYAAPSTVLLYNVVNANSKVGH